jgi:catechol 2,3-dioxygenase-like lactoylglutathione lyase family enzyme
LNLRLFAIAVLSSLTVAATAQMPDAPLRRPKITGISHIAVYTSDAAATDHFYREIIGAVKAPDPENAKGVRYMVSATQFIEVLPLPADAGINRLDHTAWKTEDAQTMRRWLGSKSYKVPDHVERGADGSFWFDVKDPEGNKVEFVQPPANPKAVVAIDAIGHHIIHVGYLVHSRALEDTFYRDLLGFKPYWFGGMSDDKVQWVSQQAPDSHDWMEYMLTSAPGPGIPSTISKHDLGVVDHFSIGQESVEDAYKVLAAGNRLTGVHDDKPKIGKDGKGQFNMYDPDGIRAELMNLHATEKPCCSAFTADDPAE